MDKVKLTREQIADLERERTINLILNRVSDWHKPKEVNPQMLASFLYEQFYGNSQTEKSSEDTGRKWPS